MRTAVIFLVCVAAPLFAQTPRRSIPSQSQIAPAAAPQKAPTALFKTPPKPPQLSLPEVPRAPWNDTNRSILELAAVASFAWELNQAQHSGAYAANIAGWSERPPYRLSVQDQMARLDRIAHSSHAALGKLAHTTKILARDNYRILAAHQQWGNTPWKMIADGNTVMATGYQWAWSDAEDYRRSEPQHIRYGDRVVVTEGEPYEKSERTRELQEKVWADTAQVLKNAQERGPFDDYLRELQCENQRQLHALWQKELLPLLTRVFGASAEKTMTNLSCRVLNGTVQIGNFTSAPMTNLAISVRFRNRFNDEATWHAMVPLLRPNQYLALDHPMEMKHHGVLWKNASVAISIISLHGKFEAALDLESPTATNAPARDAVLAEARRNLERGRELKPAFTQAFPVAEKFWTIRSNLMAACAQRSFGLAVTNGPGSTLLEIQSLNTNSGTVTALLSIVTAEGIVAHHLQGRMVAELERGVVLGFDVDRIEWPPAALERQSRVRAEVDARRAEQARKGIPVRNGIVPGQPAPAPSLAGRVLTSPAEILEARARDDGEKDRQINHALMLVGMGGPTMSVHPGPTEASHKALFVFSVDEKRRATLQTTPRNFEPFAFHPLSPVKK
jgi:hypothetical protein